MKKLALMTMVAIAGSSTVFAKPAADRLSADKMPQMSLASARCKITEAIQSPDVMKETMKRLVAEDQVKFLSDVNRAIGSMPASLEERTAKFLNANHAAVAAQKDNVVTLLAEVFASVSPESLTVINERFASDLLNRAANPNVSFTDDQYARIAVETQKKINARTEELDNASARSAFAMLMFIRASNGTPTNLCDRLVATLKDADARDLARTEWIPAALGLDGREASYEPLLASADAGRRPDLAQVLVIAGPQYLDSILADIVGKDTDPMSFMRTRTPVLDAVQNPLVEQMPTLDGGLRRADIPIPPDGDPRHVKPQPVPPAPEPDPCRCPCPYPFQTF